MADLVGDKQQGKRTAVLVGDKQQGDRARIFILVGSWPAGRPSGRTIKNQAQDPGTVNPQ